MSRLTSFAVGLPVLAVLAVLMAGCGVDGNDKPASVADLGASSTSEARTETAGLTGASPPPAPLPTTPTAAPCTDNDADGYGLGSCLHGRDCDDHDPRVTDECYRCLRPAAGCACAPDSAPRPCDVDTDRDSAGPGALCHLGQRTCRDGAWSRCLPYHDAFRFVGAVSACPGSCTPDCYHQVECPEPGDALPPGSTGVVVGNAPAAVFCPAGTGAGGVTPACTTLSGASYTRAVSPLSWLDACSAPGQVTVLAGSDDGTTTATLPFGFAYYGSPFTTVGLSANGMVSFGVPSGAWANQPLPYAAVPSTLFAFWDDLQLRRGICLATFGTAPSRRFVIEWADAGFHTSSGPLDDLTFEAVLSERTNTLDVLYNSMSTSDPRATGSNATLGIEQGPGALYDQVAYDTPGAVGNGSSFRWTPSGPTTSCAAGTYTQVFQATCGNTTQVPTWGQFNFTSTAPPGTSITFVARAAATFAGLATAPPVRLPDAPAGMPGLPTSVDLGENLRAAYPGANYERMQYVQVTAQLNPGAMGAFVPTLGSVEVQYSCDDVEITPICQPGSPCYEVLPCHRGVLNCVGPRPLCTDAGLLPAGTSCGAGSVCTAAGACLPCNAGATCDTGNVCTTGQITCDTGAPVCTVAGTQPVGTLCAPVSYTRGGALPGWLDACAAPAAVTLLARSDNGTASATLPFVFRYYGTPYTSAGISANGLLGFPSASSLANSAPLPAAPANTVFAFWDDLVMRGGVCVATFGAAPARVWVAEWNDAHVAAGGVDAKHLTFEVQLEEASQAITVLYHQMNGSDPAATGGHATLGIQSGTGATYDQVAYDTAGAATTGTGYRWTPVPGLACNASATCAPCATSETCNGLDDNCNGLIDEGIAPITCGVGGCARTVPGCAAGAVPTCVPGAPAAETCNGIDDDCNGVVDDGCAGSITCPADLTVPAGSATPLATSSAVRLNNYVWTITAGPSGGASTAGWSPAAPTGPSATLTPYIVGVYTVQVSAVTGAGAPVACSFHVTAASHGLRVQLTWDGPGDLDLHLHDGTTSSPWYSTDDCYYGNNATSWGAQLDFDNTTANGPENARMDSPVIGVAYTVAVHNYANGLGRTATVQIFCGTTTGTTPTATFASTPLSGGSGGNCTGNSFWEVARVVFTGPDTCTVTPVGTYEASSNACLAY